MQKTHIFALVMDQLRLSQRLGVLYNRSNTPEMQKLLAELSDVHRLLHSQIFEATMNIFLKKEEKDFEEKICLCFKECLQNLSNQHAVFTTSAPNSVPVLMIDVLQETQNAWGNCKQILSQLQHTRELNYNLNLQMEQRVFKQTQKRIKQLFKNNLPNLLELELVYTQAKGFKGATQSYVNQVLQEKKLEACFRVLITQVFEKHYFYMACLKKGFLLFYLPPGTVGFFQDAVYTRRHWYWRNADAWKCVIDHNIDEEIKAKTSTVCFFGRYSDFVFGPLDRRQEGLLGLTIFTASAEPLRLQAPEEGLPWHDFLGAYLTPSSRPALPKSKPPLPPSSKKV